MAREEILDYDCGLIVLSVVVSVDGFYEVLEMTLNGCSAHWEIAPRCLHTYR